MELPPVPPGPPPPVPPLHESPIAPERSEVPWKAREAVAIALLGIITGGFISILIATRFRRGDPTLQLLVVIALEGGLGAWVILYVKLRYQAGLRQLGLRFSPSDVGAGVLAALVGLGAGGVINNLVLQIGKAITHKTVTTPKQLPTIHQSGEWVLAFLAVVVIAPLAEEMFFRGFLYQALRRWRGVPQAMVLSALFFGVAHLSPVIIPAIFALGLVLAYTFQKRGSLAATITAHMTYNLVGFLYLVVQSRH